ncbi:hypothetical protein MNB_SV-4-200 [hydrothermal vent metagenome]|uniref:Uncharacterized protein n=1 Tax=hydrothermal vent metagenome TaxID=652676 RepID=A0A1W1E700_9ZZZZ
MCNHDNGNILFYGDFVGIRFTDAIGLRYKYDIFDVNGRVIIVLQNED